MNNARRVIRTSTNLLHMHTIHKNYLAIRQVSPNVTHT